jgi:hypothetical protein
VRERLVTVLLTVVVPEAADPGDAAALVADAVVGSVLDTGHAVGVQGHLPVAGGTVRPTLEHSFEVPTRHAVAEPAPGRREPAAQSVGQCR